MLRVPGTRFERASRGLARTRIPVFGAALLAAGLLFAAEARSASTQPPDVRSIPIAGAFVYPVGDELDYRKAAPGSHSLWYVSDPYLAVRGSKKQRTHYGVDISCGRGGDEVRSIGSGVVVVADASAMIKVTQKRRVKVPVTTKTGKHTTKTVTKTRTRWKWRTGWGNYVVIRHLLPNGESIHSLYAHLASKSVTVKSGDVVAAGEPIGKVGKTGRANSPHLHLEVRRSAPSEDEADGSEEDAPTATSRTFALLDAVDPLAFLDGHVRRFEDLEPGSWEARYALAACRDGLTFAEGKE